MAMLQHQHQLTTHEPPAILQVPARQQTSVPYVSADIGLKCTNCVAWACKGIMA